MPGAAVQVARALLSENTQQRPEDSRVDTGVKQGFRLIGFNVRIIEVLDRGYEGYTGFDVALKFEPLRLQALGSFARSLRFKVQVVLVSLGFSV